MSHDQRSVRRTRAYRAGVEGLEGRSLMTANAIVNNGVALVIGSPGPDEILVEQRGVEVRLNGKPIGTIDFSPVTRSPRTISRIEVQGLGGHDAIAFLGLNPVNFPGGISVANWQGTDAIAAPSWATLGNDPSDLRITVDPASLGSLRVGLVPSLKTDEGTIAAWEGKLSDATKNRDSYVASWNKWRTDTLAGLDKVLKSWADWRDGFVSSWSKWRDGEVARLTSYMDSMKSWAEQQLSALGYSLSDIGFGLTGYKAKSFKQYADDAAKGGKDVIQAGKDVVQAVGDGAQNLGQAAVAAANAAAAWAKGVANQVRDTLTRALNSAKAELEAAVNKANAQIEQARAKFADAKAKFDAGVADAKAQAKKAIDTAWKNWNDFQTTAAGYEQKASDHAADMAAMADKLIVAGLGKAARYGGDRWKAVKDWTADAWHDLIHYDPLAWTYTHPASSAGVTQIMLYPNGGGDYEVAADVASADAYLWGVQWTVERDGQPVKSEYRGVSNDGGRFRTYSLTFRADQPGPYTVTFALKDADNRWFQTITRPVTLPVTSPVTLFRHVVPDASGSTGGGTGAGGGTGTGSYETSPAEQERGFPLPYVLASSGVYTDDDDNYVLGLDMVEVTKDTQVTVALQRQDAQGRPVNAEGYARDQLQHWKDMLDRFKSTPGSAYGYESMSVEELYRAYKNEPGSDVGTLEEYLRNWATNRFDDFFLTVYGKTGEAKPTLEQLIQADRALAGFAPQSITATLTGDQVKAGYRIPGEVKYTGNGLKWAATLTVKESARSKPTDFPLNQGLNADFFKKVDAAMKGVRKGLDRYRGWVETYQAQQADREAAEALRRARLFEVIAGVGTAFQEAGKAVLYAIPGVGLYLNGHDTYMYAKQGQLGAAAVSGAFTLLDILGLGLGEQVLSKVGKLVPLGSKGRNVIKLEGALARDEKALSGVFEKGLKALTAEAAEVKAAGMTPAHALGLQEYSMKNGGALVVVRASNVKSMPYQGKAGYLPKPGALGFAKTDAETGLVMGRRLKDGSFVDAAGNKTGYLVRGDGKIVNNVAGDKNFGKATDFKLVVEKEANGLDNTVGYVVDASGNKFYSDYDLMGVYRHTPGTQNQWVADSTVGVLSELNAAIDPKLNMIQHAANDDYWKAIAGQVQPGNPSVGNSFLVMLNGKLSATDLAGLKTLYKSFNIIQ